MICEMCGDDVATTYRVEVEGSVLRVCEHCRHFGELLDPLIAPAAPTPRTTGTARPPVGAAPAARRGVERDLFSELPDMELANDWGHRVRVAREQRGWTQEELGKRLNEKKSLVLKLESGSFHPPDTIVRKVESLLKIRLRADPAESV